jgi:D-glycero-D-manno-heptose 1,7-bisphosphate phosphatase
MTTKAAFLDRDGVLNRKMPEGQYVTRWEEMRFLPCVAGAIILLRQAGFRVVVVSNQRCVAKGLLTVQKLESMHRRMCEKFASEGATIDAVYYCPHDTEPPCACRKPAPGLLLEAAREHLIDLGSSWMIGDTTGDMEAGRKAGCKTARLQDPNEPADGLADVVAPSLLEAARQILRREEVGVNCSGTASI